MISFHYEAYNAAGHRVRGMLEAEDVPSLEARLRTLGLWLITTRTSRDRETHVGANHRTHVRRSDLIQFFVQMSLLLKAGITLPKALERLATDNEGGRLGIVLRGIHDQVVLGTSLHQAMASYPRSFDRQTVAMIEAGEASGRLTEVFDNLGSYLEWVDQLAADMRQALIYPSMVLTAALGLVTLLFTLVVPRFVGLLTDLNLAVPPLTRAVMTLSQLMIDGAPVWLSVLIGGPFLLKLALRREAWAVAFDRLLMRLPIFGELFAMFGYSRLCHNLALLCRADLPLLRGLEICQPLTGNRAIEVSLRQTRQMVTEGMPLHRALQEQQLYPSTLITMIATGESSGNLPFALQSAADYYNKMIPRRIKIVFAIFDPAMMISLIAVVGTVALSVMLPILQLWQGQ